MSISGTYLILESEINESKFNIFFESTNSKFAICAKMLI